MALDEKGRSSFQLLQGFDMGKERPPIVFYAFDLLRLNGKDLQGLPIEERKAKLEELLQKPPGVIRYSISFTKNIPELLDRAGKLGRISDLLKILLAYSTFSWKKELHVVAGDLSGTNDIAGSTRMVAWVDRGA